MINSIVEAISCSLNKEFWGMIMKSTMKKLSKV
jgi:hypothetical protein